MTEEQMELVKKLIGKHGIRATDGEWTLIFLGVGYGLSEQQIDEYITLDTTDLLQKHERMLHFCKKKSGNGYEKVMQYIIRDTQLSAAQIEQLRKAVEAKMPEEDVYEMAQSRKDVMEIRRCVEFYEMMKEKENPKEKAKKSRRGSR